MNNAPFRWEEPAYFYWLGLLPLLWLVFWLYLRWQKKARARLTDAGLLAWIAPGVGSSRIVWRMVCFSLAYGMVIVALVNPQYGYQNRTVTRKGADVYVALDLSRSMNAEDVQPSRFQRARLFLRELIDKLKGDRIGLIVFGGNAYIQMPLTVDYAATRMFLESMTTEMIPTQGTAIGESIRTALDAFGGGKEQHRSIIIVSDGENHQGDALEAAQNAADSGITIITVGVGSREGGPVPDLSQKSRRYLRDQQDQIVVSRLSEAMLKQIARMGNGRYFRLEQARRTAHLVTNALSGLEKKSLETRIFSRYHSYFQYPLALAILFLFLGLVLDEKKKLPKWTKDTFSQTATKSA